MNILKRILLKVSRFFKKKPQFKTGARARMFVDGREVRFWEGENVNIQYPSFPAIDVLGKFEVDELQPPEIKIKLLKGPK